MSVASLLLWQRSSFLNETWYLVLAALIVVLVVEQIVILRDTRANRDAERQNTLSLGERPIQAKRQGESIVAIKNGLKILRVVEDEILSVRAADDYCDIVLRDGSTMMSTSGLARFMTTIRDRIVRVNRSHAVNRAHVVMIEPKLGGGRQLLLSNGSLIPIGRRYEAEVGKLFNIGSSQNEV
jgi:DNA-binding LytR/AlgR family response regulator